MLLPKVKLIEVKALFMPCFIGVLLASLFGLAHDQFTYAISPEYFTKFKYQQFSYLPLSENHRLNAAMIGVMATWWVGLFCAWFLGRWHLKNSAINQLSIKLYKSFVVVFICVPCFTFLGYIYGLVYPPRASVSSIAVFASSYDVTDIQAFVRVAYIHNFSYIGALVGALASMVLVRRSA